jgi:hypothetical protein
MDIFKFNILLGLHPVLFLNCNRSYSNFVSISKFLIGISGAAQLGFRVGLPKKFSLRKNEVRFFHFSDAVNSTFKTGYYFFTRKRG